MLTNVTHLLLDEVHERDSNYDFLLAVVRELLVSRRSSAGQDLDNLPEFHVVLMSATLQAKSKSFELCFQFV